MVRHVVALVAIGGGLLASCKPEFDGRPSRVQSPRILAVRSDPAESAPAGSVTLRALTVGGASSATLSWAVCTTRKPLTELGAVDPSCLAAAAPGLLQVGTGPTAMAEVPKDACRLFGPETPDAKPGEPNGRPVDADSTGGYYLPIRVLGSDDPTAGAVRLACGVSGATAEQVVTFEQRARPNQNPTIAGVTAAGKDAVGGFAAGRRTAVVLRVSWPECPASPVCGDGVCGVDEDKSKCDVDCKELLGCGGSERYGVFDTALHENTVRREAMRVSWFSNEGELSVDRTGRAAGDPASYSENTWTAPAQAMGATIWVVLRDDRGGVAWQELSVDVK